jgi:hypothetical protein
MPAAAAAAAHNLAQSRSAPPGCDSRCSFLQDKQNSNSRAVIISIIMLVSNA